MSSNLNLNKVVFQSQLRSKPVRENFTDIENNYNSLRSEVNASIASTASEVTSARDNFSNLSNNINARKGYVNVLNGGSITETTPNSLKLNVVAGSGIVNGIGVSWASGTSATMAAPASNSRIDLVVANTDNSISIVAGSLAATPRIPDIGATQYPIAKVKLYSTTGTLTNSHITNYRQNTPYSQIGEIIPIHPDVLTASLPNQYHYSVCDGTEYLDTNFFGTASSDNVPDLTDNRFLIGASSYLTGGSNTKDLKHVHKIMSKSPTVFQALSNTTGSTTMNNTILSRVIVSGGVGANVSVQGGGTCDYYSSYPIETAFDILPAYFSVKYYMRIR